MLDDLRPAGGTLEEAFCSCKDQAEGSLEVHKIRRGEESINSRGKGPVVEGMQ